MKRRLEISRPRPARGPQEPAVSFALRLMCWHDEQFKRGWTLGELPVLSAEEIACLTESGKLLNRMCLYCHLIKESQGA